MADTREPGARLDSLELAFERNQLVRDTWTIGIFAVAAFSFLAAILGVGFGMRAMDESKRTAGNAGGSETFDIQLGDLFVKPASIEVPVGTELILNVTNDGVMPHDLKLQGLGGTEMLQAGEQATINLGVITETTQAWCTVPGHKAAGMVLDIKVSGSAATCAATATTATADATIDFSAEPVPRTSGPTTPPSLRRPGGTEHQHHLPRHRDG